MFILFTCITAIFFAFNIGASGAAASMGIAYGSGAMPIRKIAQIFCGFGVLLGAVLGGGGVVKTIGSGIVPDEIITIHLALIILVSASITLFFANLGGIPLSTSEVTVGAVVGVGMAFQTLFINKIIIIVLFWLLIPFLAFLFSFCLNKAIKLINKKLSFLVNRSWKRILSFLVILTGFLEAFSAGMNNVANSVGPLVAANIITVEKGTMLGGISVALGVIILGGKVIETNGKRITNFSLLQGSAISGIGATLVIIASLFGIPVPQTQITTCSILGIGASDNGKDMWKKAIILKLIKTWVLSPFISLFISYSLVEIFIFHRFFYAVILSIPIFIFSIFSLKIKNKENQFTLLKIEKKTRLSKLSFASIRSKRRRLQSTKYKEYP